jgi:hypothetical protein
VCEMCMSVVASQRFRLAVYGWLLVIYWRGLGWTGFFDVCTLVMRGRERWHSMAWHGLFEAVDGCGCWLCRLMRMDVSEQCCGAG